MTNSERIIGKHEWSAPRVLPVLKEVGVVPTAHARAEVFHAQAHAAELSGAVAVAATSSLEQPVQMSQAA